MTSTPTPSNPARFIEGIRQIVAERWQYADGTSMAADAAALLAQLDGRGVAGDPLRAIQETLRLGPIGYATHHDEPMLFPTRAEAALHCHEDEDPIALVPAEALGALLVQLEAAQKDQARYRWLRSTWCFSILERLFGITTGRTPGAQLDDAIDESIAADKAAAAARALAEQQEGKP